MIQQQTQLQDKSTLESCKIPEVKIEDCSEIQGTKETHDESETGKNNIALSQNDTSAALLAAKPIPFQKRDQWVKVYRIHLETIQSKKYESMDEFFDSFDSFLLQLKIKQNTQVLRIFFEELSESEQEFFEKQFLPNLAARALELPILFQDTPSVILKQHDSKPVILTKLQISCVLANMFFGTIDYSKHRSLIQWYDGPYRFETKIEKIKCLYNYFKRILAASSDHLSLHVIIQRLQYFNQQNYKTSPTLTSNIKIYQDKRIEDFLLPKHIHIDFANQCIGGGVLDTGRVQEEIMFVTCPELLISCQICECIEDKEAILMIGAERYSSYKGYAQTFQFQADFVDPRGVDIQKNYKQNVVIAIDVLFFHEHILALQYQPKMIFRELLKALTGFQVSEFTPKDNVIVTGNWGCGAFHGDVQLKFLIQWVACSMSERDIVYCTFGNENLEGIAKVVSLLKGQSTEKVIKAIKSYKDHAEKFTVFQYISKVFSHNNSNSNNNNQ